MERPIGVFGTPIFYHFVDRHRATVKPIDGGDGQALEVSETVERLHDGGGR